jgi:hypothetical protein
MKTFNLMFLFMAVNNFAFSSPNQLDFNKLEMTGMGCPGGDVKKTVDPKDPTLVRIEFPQYDLRKGQLRKSCQLVMPLLLAKDQKLEISGIQFTGDAVLSKGESVKIRLEVFLSSQKGPGKILEKTVDTSSNFTLDLPTQTMGDCGEKSNLRMQTSILAQGKTSSSKASQLSFHLRAIPCQ